MTIYDLNRKELILVLKDYIWMLTELDCAIRERDIANSNINKDFAGFAIWILKIFSFICMFPIFLVSFFVFGKLSTYILGDTIITIVFGFVCAVLVLIGYFAIRKKAINMIKEKSAVTKGDYTYLEKCIEKQKKCQEKVDRMYKEYSMPDSLRSIFSTKWIYDYLLENEDASLDSAIKMYEWIQDNSFKTSYRADEEREAIRRDNDRIVSELRRQNELLQRQNDLDYYRNMR